VVAGLGDELDEVLSRALAKDRTLRYATMEALLADLRALRSDTAPIVPAGDSTIRRASARSIAVLSFLDLSPGRDQEYFCDGMAEELISALSRIQGLHVASRTSTFAFKGKDVDVSTIGRQLRATHVLEGSVRKAGERLRITAQLITVSDGYQLWSERYDRRLDDVFAIQDDIAHSIVEALQFTLGDQTTGQLFRGRQTASLEAYHLYLKGQYFWNRRDKGGLGKALECYTQVIAIEPTYARAYAGLASCFVSLAMFTYVAPGEGFARARTAAQRALQLDESLPEAHTAFAMVTALADRDFVRGERELRRALELDPTYATGHSWYGWFLLAVGRLEESQAAYRRALALEPLSLMINTLSGALGYYARQYDEARTQLLRTIDLDPAFGAAHSFLGLVEEQMDRPAEAIAAFERANGLMDLPMVVANLAHACAVSGDADRATRLLGELEEMSQRRFVSPFFVAAVQVGLGRSDEAFGALERALEMRDGWILFVEHDPRFDALRTDARFARLVAGMRAGV
jgi:serine/threonine-protein kinase